MKKIAIFIDTVNEAQVRANSFLSSKGLIDIVHIDVRPWRAEHEQVIITIIYI